MSVHFNKFFYIFIEICFDVHGIFMCVRSTLRRKGVSFSYALVKCVSVCGRYMGPITAANEMREVSELSIDSQFDRAPLLKSYDGMHFCPIPYQTDRRVSNIYIPETQISQNKQIINS